MSQKTWMKYPIDYLTCGAVDDPGARSVCIAFFLFDHEIANFVTVHIADAMNLCATFGRGFGFVRSGRCRLAR